MSILSSIAAAIAGTVSAAKKASSTGTSSSSSGSSSKSSGNSGTSWQQKLEGYKSNPEAGYSEIARAQSVYEQKKAAGDIEGANAAHKWANQIRDAMGIADQYDRTTGAKLSGGTTQQQTQQQPSQQPVQQTQQQPSQQPVQQTNANNWPYYEQLLLGILNQPSAYTPPSASEIKAQASQYADLQVDPVLSSITDMIQKAITNYNKAKTETEAAYAGIPERTKAMLEEARNYALENAIARGMGRSGVVNWETEKRTTPIIQWSQEKEGEKAAKLASLAEELAAAESSAGRMRTDAETRRGQLEAQRLAELEQMSRAMEQQAQAQKWQQAMGIANMALQDKSIDQAMLTNLLKQFMYG